MTKAQLLTLLADVPDHADIRMADDRVMTGIRVWNNPNSSDVTVWITDVQPDEDE